MTCCNPQSHFVLIICSNGMILLLFLSYSYPFQATKIYFSGHFETYKGRHLDFETFEQSFWVEMVLLWPSKPFCIHYFQYFLWFWCCFKVTLTDFKPKKIFRRPFCINYLQQSKFCMILLLFLSYSYPFQATKIYFSGHFETYKTFQQSILGRMVDLLWHFKAILY